MPLSFNGVVFNDPNANGVQDAGESGALGMFVQVQDVLNNFAVLAQGSCAADGSYAFDLTNYGSDNVQLHCAISDEFFVSTNNQDQNFIPSQVNGSVATTLGIAPRCTRVVSRWVLKICWIPGQGVRVTYKHHRRGPFTCVYPGTSQLDYTAFLNAPSKGRWAYRYYRPRPYIPWTPSP
jgi:hypothetical protein